MLLGPLGKKKGTEETREGLIGRLASSRGSEAESHRSEDGHVVAGSSTKDPGE